MAVKHKVIECHEAKDDGRLNMLIRVLETIEQQQQCRVGYDREKMCEQIVMFLGSIAMPTTAADCTTFMTHVVKIQEQLIKALAEDDKFIFATLRALYSEISNPEKQPTPTMSIVLQLINVQHLPSAVNFILNNRYSDASLERAFMTLCNWLSKWTNTPNLGPLILEFMKGLEAEQHYEILDRVTLAYVERLFILIILPVPRESVAAVVFRMLARMQHNSSAFHKIIKSVPSVLESLSRENTEKSKKFLEVVVNLCMVLMERFSNYKYIELEKVLEKYTVSTPYNKALVNCKSWLDTADQQVPRQLTPGKVGLNNLGNTCYMNSVLQALFMTKIFRNDILMKSQNATPLISKLQSLFALLQFSERSSLSPSDISSAARPPGFQVGQQHDSSEFLGYLLDVLHEQEGSVYSFPNTITNTTSASNAVTLVKKSFGGKTLMQSCCYNCRSSSEREDTFRDLQLSFPSNCDNQSVQTLIDYYLEPEKLCDDNQYHCDSCRGLTDGERLTKIIDPPPRLVLTLKHFRYDPATQTRTKILQRVKLDDQICLENVEYQLYAAVVHCGSSVDSGHYYTYAKDGDDWYKFNDCFVMRSKAEELYDLRPPEAPYILFYSRLDRQDPEAMTKTDLSDWLQSILHRDYQDLLAEKKPLNSIIERNRQSRNDDPPPPGCGGGGIIDSSHSRFVC